MTVTGRVLEIYHRAHGRDYVVMLVKTAQHGSVRALGPVAAIAEQAQVLLTGRFCMAPSGREFRFKTARVLAIEGAGLLAILAQRFGITLTEAEVLGRRFGATTPAQIEADPALVEGVAELAETTRAKITQVLRRGGGPARELLKRAGVRDQSANSLVAAYGEGLSAALAANPYLPCVHAAEPLASGDRLSQLAGRTTTDAPPLRVAAAIMEALRGLARAGHVTREDVELSGQAGRLLRTPVTPAQFAAGLAVLEADARVTHQGGRVALAEHAQAEIRLVEELNRLGAHAGERPDISAARLRGLAGEHGLTLTPADGARIARAFAAPLAVAPFTLARHGAFLKFLANVFSLLSAEVTVIAPTQQVKRLAGALGYPVRHLREVTEETRLTGDYVLVLEADRLSLPEVLALSARVADGTSLWFFGDARRVGGATPGQVFRDLYGCKGVARLDPGGFAAGELARDLEALFHHGAPEKPSPALDGRVHVIYGTAAELVGAAVVLASELLPALGYTEPGDVLFVCPAKRDGLSVTALNAALGESLKLRAFPAPGAPCVFEAQTASPVRRGERGVVSAANHKRVTALFEDESVEAFANQLLPGYCVTAHRAAGLLARAVVWVAATEHGALLNRELLFSATSGAIERVFLLTEPQALAQTLTTSRPEGRSGWFAELAQATL